MDITKLTDDALEALAARATEQLQKNHPLREHIRDKVPNADLLVANVVNAREVQSVDGFEKALNLPKQYIYQAFKPEIEDLNPSGTKEETLRKIFGEDLSAARDQYDELERSRRLLGDTYLKEMRVLVKETMAAKKKMFERPGGRNIIMGIMNKQLAEHNAEWGARFSGALKGADTVEQIFHNHVSPESFVWALEGRGDSHALNTAINQARELAYLEEKSLSEAVTERLKAVGLTDFQTKFFAEVTKAHESGTGQKFIQDLYKKYQPEIERLGAQKLANLQESTARIGKTHAESGAAPISREAELAADKLESASGEIVQEGKGIMKLLARSKTPVAVGATAAAAVGGWALYESQKRKQSEPGQSKT